MPITRKGFKKSSSEDALSTLGKAFNKTNDWVNNIVTENERRKMIESVANQKVGGSSRRSTMKRYIVGNELKEKMRKKGVYENPF